MPLSPVKIVSPPIKIGSNLSLGTRPYVTNTVISRQIIGKVQFIRVLVNSEGNICNTMKDFPGLISWS